LIPFIFVHACSKWFVDTCSILSAYTSLCNYVKLPDNGKREAAIRGKLITGSKGVFPKYSVFVGLKSCNLTSQNIIKRHRCG
jgi:hypothetical protein